MPCERNNGKYIILPNVKNYRIPHLFHQQTETQVFTQNFTVFASF